MSLTVREGHFHDCRRFSHKKVAQPLRGRSDLPSRPPRQFLYGHQGEQTLRIGMLAWLVLVEKKKLFVTDLLVKRSVIPTTESELVDSIPIKNKQFCEDNNNNLFPNKDFNT